MKRREYKKAKKAFMKRWENESRAPVIIEREQPLVMPTRDKIRCAAEVVLGSKNVALWADWDLTRPSRFDQAAEWLTQQVTDVLDEAYMRRGDER